MKNKKTGLMILAIAIQFFGFSLVANAQTCASLTGTCVPEVSCAAPAAKNWNATNCGAGGVCCVSQISSCSSLGGLCVPSSSCNATNNVTNPHATDCGNGGVCCVPNVVNNNAGTGGEVTTEFLNPLKFTTVEEVTTALLDNLRGILATIAVVFIVIGGIMYMLSTGDEKMMERAKATWTAAVIGLAIALAAPSFLKEIMIILQADTSPVANALTIKDIAIRILNLLLSLVGIFGILGLVIGAGFYLTAYGDDDRIDKGKEIITASVIGIIVAFGALVIVRQVASILGAV